MYPRARFVWNIEIFLFYWAFVAFVIKGTHSFQNHKGTACTGLNCANTLRQTTYWSLDPYSNIATTLGRSRVANKGQILSKAFPSLRIISLFWLQSNLYTVILPFKSKSVPVSWLTWSPTCNLYVNLLTYMLTSLLTQSSVLSSWTLNAMWCTQSSIYTRLT